MNHLYRLKSLVTAVALACGSTAHASPSGGTVVAGDVSITSTAGNTTINQSSQNAILNWQSFDIGVADAVRFVQPNSSAIALNRVLGTDPTRILGSLSANGKVFLVNPNGILFGNGAQVNVGALVASTRDIDNHDFLAGNYKFDGTSKGGISNRGSINADGGYVALLGANISNQGVITAKLGTVALAAGNAMTLDVAGDGLLNVTVNAGAVNALVQNGGLIQTDGGQVLLTARSAGDLLPSAVNNTGVIQAQTIQNRNGVIKLLGDMQSGTVGVDGTLDASALNGGNGGFIETSAAHVKIAPTASITTAASSGTTGHWLIDPVDFTIAASGGDITGSALSTLLNSNDVTVQTTTGTNTATDVFGTTGSNGDINVNDFVSWSANKLTLNAQRNININTTMNASGTANLALEYGQGAVAASNTSTVNVLAPVNLPTGNHFTTKLGSDGSVVNYAVINDMTAFQAINSGLTGNYALGSNLDASGVSGFTSIGPMNAYNDTGHEFSGAFDGLGHTISNLTVNQPASNFVGTFSGVSSSGTIRNLGMVAVNVTGVYDIGGLVGINYGTISNSYVTGTVQGADFVGGMVGYTSAGSLIASSYSSATVATGPNYDTSAGGLVGYNYVGTINDSYATGSVTAARAGGLVGFHNGGTINNSYAAGPVQHNLYGNSPGGLVAAVVNGAVTNNSYWDITTSGQSNSAAGTGLTTTQLEAALPTGFSSSIWGNSGNKSSPYLLSNAGPVLISTDNTTTFYRIVLSLNQLQAMNDNLAGKYALGNDIDASATSSWNSGAGFTPIGSSSPFTGDFDGLGHVVSGLMINLPANLFVGLFSDARGALRNIGVENANITGNAYVGPLAGTSDGTISNAHGSGTVVSVNNAGGLVGNNNGTISTSYSTASASGGWSGGIAGNNNANGLITNSYATGHVAGGSSGGLIGSNYGSASYVYATGLVTGNSNGGLIGSHGPHATVNGYWDTQTSGQSSTNGNDATGLTTAQLEAGLPSGFSSSIWGNVGNKTTPYLLSNPGPVLIATDSSATYYSLVTNLNQLQGMSANLAGNYALANSIDATATSGWNSGAGFAPIGSNASRFTGSFDGLGNTISNLRINRNIDNVGLFGVVDSGGKVSNLLMSGANINNVTRNNVGGLVGYNYGSVDKVYVTSMNISGGRQVGALVGTNEGAITRSAADNSSVSGTFYTGGLVGYQLNSGSIKNSYANVNLANNLEVGGLVGTMDGGLIEDSYAAGTASGNQYVGGLVGYVGGGTVNNSFWNSSTNGSGFGTAAPAGTGTAGLTAAALKAQASFTPQGSGAGEWDFGSTWFMYEGQTTPLLRTFMTPLTVTASNVTKAYTGLAYNGSGGVTYSVTPNMSNVLGTLSFTGGGINVGGSSITPSGLYSNQLGYIISFAAGTLTINPYVVSLTGTRAYDGTNVLAAGSFSLGTLANGETLTLTGNGTVVGKNVGSGKTVTLGTLALGNGTGLASNYTFVGGTQTASITQKVLTATAVASNKVYDGNTSASANLSLVGLVGSETLGAGNTATFNSKDVASANLVTVSGVTLSDGSNGGLASNYSLASGQTATAHITAKTLTATVTAANKVYDGTTASSATLSGLTGLVGSETLGVSGATATFNSKDVATANLVTVNGATLTNGSNGGLAGNYSLASGQTAAANITAKSLSATVTASNKVYDGNTSASVTLGSLTGLIGTETLGANSTATFNSKDVATANLVTVGSLALTNGSNGGLASNYSLTGSQTAVAHITPKSLTATFNVSNKVYDGNTSASVNLGSLSGLVGSETLGVNSAATFNSKDVATANLVTVNSATLSNGGSGGLAGNYSLASGQTVAAGVTAKSLSTTVNASNKVYDGTTTAGVTVGSLSGLVGNETLGASAAGTFNSKNVATANLVTVNGFTLTNGSNGGLASNYNLAGGQTAAASITPKGLTVANQTALNKVYDGTTVAVLTGGSLTGVVIGDAVVLNETGTFATASVGSGIAVTAADSLSGGAASNYSLTQPTGFAADITAIPGYQNAAGQVSASAQVTPNVQITPNEQVLPAGVPVQFGSPSSSPGPVGLTSYDFAGLNLTVVVPDGVLPPGIEFQDTKDTKK